MTKEDKAEIKEMLSSAVGVYAATTDGKFDVINTKLIAIIEQTTKTNGRVNKLEDKVNGNISEKITDMDTSLQVLKATNSDSEHILHCPHTARIQELENQQLSRKTIRNFLIALLASISTILGIALALFKLFGGNPAGN